MADDRMAWRKMCCAAGADNVRTDETEKVSNYVEHRIRQKFSPDWLSIISIMFLSFWYILKTNREGPIKVSLPRTSTVGEFPYTLNGKTQVVSIILFMQYHCEYIIAHFNKCQCLPTCEMILVTCCLTKRHKNNSFRLNVCK